MYFQLWDPLLRPQSQAEPGRIKQAPVMLLWRVTRALPPLSPPPPAALGGTRRADLEACVHLILAEFLEEMTSPFLRYKAEAQRGEAQARMINKEWGAKLGPRRADARAHASPPLPGRRWVLGFPRAGQGLWFLQRHRARATRGAVWMADKLLPEKEPDGPELSRRDTRGWLGDHRWGHLSPPGRSGHPKLLGSDRRFPGPDSAFCLPRQPGCGAARQEPDLGSHCAPEGGLVEARPLKSNEQKEVPPNFFFWLGTCYCPGTL